MRDGRADALPVSALARAQESRVLTAFRYLPKVVASRALGLLERVPLPKPVRPRVIDEYVRRYGVNLHEAAVPVDGFRTLNELFVRKLKPGARPIDADPASVVSPVDGIVASFGPIDRGRVFQAKGLDYSLEELVALPALSSGLVYGCSVTLYLAPGDYHRIHAPVEGDAAYAVHVPGTLWPVNALAAAAIDGLFVKNERVVTVLESRFGPVVVVKVGAFNVGSVRTEYDPTISRGRGMRYRAYETPRHFAKGQELAHFEMGSTVIVCLPKRFELEPTLRVDARLKLGEPIARARY